MDERPAGKDRARCQDSGESLISSIAVQASDATERARCSTLPAMYSPGEAVGEGRRLGDNRQRGQIPKNGNCSSEFTGAAQNCRPKRVRRTNGSYGEIAPCSAASAPIHQQTSRSPVRSPKPEELGSDLPQSKRVGCLQTRHLPTVLQAVRDLQSRPHDDRGPSRSPNRRTMGHLTNARP